MILEAELMRLLAISCLVALIIQTVKVLFNVKEGHPRYARLQPLVALILGGVGGYFALSNPPVVSVMWGVIAGGFSSGGYEVIDGVIKGFKERAKRGELPVGRDDR